jgi:hypothetical protein
MLRLVLLSGDEVTPQNLALLQATVFVKGQRHLYSLEASLATNQRFVDHKDPFLAGTQVIAQVNPSLDDFAAAMAAHVDVISKRISLPAPATKQ